MKPGKLQSWIGVENNSDGDYVYTSFCEGWIRVLFKKPSSFFLSAQTLALLSSFQAKLEEFPEQEEDDEEGEEAEDDTGW